MFLKLVKLTKHYNKNKLSLPYSIKSKTLIIKTIFIKAIGHDVSLIRPKVGETLPLNFKPHFWELELAILPYST